MAGYSCIPSARRLVPRKPRADAVATRTSPKVAFNFTDKNSVQLRVRRGQPLGNLCGEGM